MMLEKLIEIILVNKPETRDSDSKLIANVWFVEVEKMNKDLSRITGLELLKLLGSGKLAQPETITRIRRKSQEEQEKLRGEKYAKRQEKASKVARNLDHLFDS